MIGACVSGVMAINFGGIIYPWNSGQTIACFVVSGVLFIVFGLQQSFCILTTEDTRIFPCQFLQQKTLVILFMQMACGVTIAFVPIYFVPLFFQFARNDSAIEAGVRLLPLVCLMVFATILNGALMSKFGYYMPWYLAGGVIALIGSALMYTVKLDTSNSKIYGYTVLLGIGAGTYTQASFAVAQVKVKPHEIPMAIGFIALAQILGATIALAIANSVFLNQATNGILAIVPHEPRGVVQGAVSGAGSTFFQTLDPSVKAAVLGAVTHSISRVYILAITAGALTIVLSVFMSREKVSSFWSIFFLLTTPDPCVAIRPSAKCFSLATQLRIYQSNPCIPSFESRIADLLNHLALSGSPRSWLNRSNILGRVLMALQCIAEFSAC